MSEKRIPTRLSQFFQMRWTERSMPFMGKGERETEGWIRLRESMPAGEGFLPLVVDAWPSPTMPMMRGPSPLSSLAWSLEVVDEPRGSATDDWWLVNAAVDCASGGYAQGDALLWDAHGRLVAMSRQTLTVFDRKVS